MIKFWTWFFRGISVEEYPADQAKESISEGKAGIRAYFDKWLIFHIVIGLFLMFIVPMRINEAARSILLPLAGIFIGLTFAWGGNAVTLMQSDEINILADYKPGGLREYVFKFQAAILVLLFTMVAWGFAGLDIFESLYCSSKFGVIYKAFKAFLFFLVSLSLRDCWHVVMGAQAMVLYKRKIKKAINERNEGRTSNNGMKKDGP
jgi:hypothetical protein